jgi:lysophospholipase L1-like esterase
LDLKRTVAALSAHSFGQLVIFPWTYTKTPHPNADNYRKLAERIKSALKNGPLE